MADFTPVPKSGTPAQRRGRANASRGKQFEREVAKETEGRRVPLSGGGSYKGDVTTKYILLECKTSAITDTRGAKTISVQQEWLLKAEQEANAEGKLMWALPFRYKGTTRAWAVVDWKMLLAMFQQLAYLYELQAWLARHDDVQKLIRLYGGPQPAEGTVPVGLPLFEVEGNV